MTTPRKWWYPSHKDIQKSILLPNVESGSTIIATSKTLPHEDCDEAHHTNTCTKCKTTFKFWVRLHYNSTWWNMNTPRLWWNPSHKDMNKIQYNFQMLIQDPLQFYIMKHHHTKIAMRPITKIHKGTKTQCHFTPLNHASIQFYQFKNCHTKDCDETHHTNTHTKPNSTLQMLNDK